MRDHESEVEDIDDIDGDVKDVSVHQQRAFHLPSIKHTKDNDCSAIDIEMLSLDDRGDESCPSNLVIWDGDDQEDMMNISKVRKWLITNLLTLCAFQVICLSSIWSTSASSIQEHFNTSPVVASLGISLFIFGLGTGPLFLAPLSEFYGRKIIYCIGFACYTIFQFITAFATNLPALLIGRYLTAFSGSAFMSVVPGTLSDIFSKDDITLPMAVYSCGPFIGPGFGPLIGGFVELHLGFRWSFYIMLIWSTALLIILVLFIPETFPPKLLHYKAKRLRKTTGNENLYAAFERDQRSVIVSIITSCERPFMMLVREPVLMILCFFTGFLVALVYLFFVAFPLVFGNVYGFSIQYIGLSFIGLSIGMIIGGLTSPFWVSYHRNLVKKNGGVIVPEFRVPQMIIGSLILPVAIFMFAWTIYRSVHWIVCEIATVILGFGSLYLYTGILSYIADFYRPYAASATAANVFVRCIMAGTFPLFGRQMYEAMGYHWATSVLGFFALLMIPSSICFYKYGDKLRQHSKYVDNE